MNPGDAEITINGPTVYTATNARVEISPDGERWTSLGGLQGFAVSTSIAAQAFALMTSPWAAAWAQIQAAAEAEAEAWRKAWEGRTFTFTARMNRTNWRLLAVLLGDHRMRVQRYRRLQPYYRMVRSKETT
jgi:hypothetical protein